MSQSELIKITFTGDFVPNDETLALVQEGKMDEFAPDLKAEFVSSDLVLVNLEAPLTLHHEPILKTGRNFSAHPDNAKLLSHLGVGVACLANNHILDQNEQGVLDTIEACEKHGIDSVGAGRNIQEAAKSVIRHIKGKKIGIINFCEQEFSIATERSAGANPFDIIDNYRQIKALREKVDFLIVTFHGSLEYHHLPMPHYKKACEFFVEAGADIVVGHHPHYYGGYSYHQGKPIFYSLGNFFARSLRKDPEQFYSYVLKVELSENMTSFSITPIRIEEKLPFIKKNVGFSKQIIDDINREIEDNILFDEYWSRVSKNEMNRIFVRIFSINNFFYKIRKRLPFKSQLGRFRFIVLKNSFHCESHSSLLRMITDIVYKKENKK